MLKVNAQSSPQNLNTCIKQSTHKHPKHINTQMAKKYKLKSDLIKHPKSDQKHPN